MDNPYCSCKRRRAQVGAGALSPGETTVELSFAATSIDRIRLEEDQTKGQMIAR